MKDEVMTKEYLEKLPADVSLLRFKLRTRST